MYKLIKYMWLMLAVIMMASNAHAGNRGQYLKSSEMPNALLYLPPPPDTTMLAINGDYARWIWGKSVRPTPRGEMADDDEIFGIVRMCPIFSDILGIEINEENTPAIYRLMNNSGDTGSLSCLSMQQTYFRKRPFLLMNESTWGAHDLYDDLSRKSSYPSYHTGSGWGTTLALAEMAPHLQDTILRRGYEYGISRVIVGAHWQSDVDAAILCASAAIARSHATAAYQADLAAARSEYMQLTGLSESQINGSTTPSALKILDAPAMADSYFYYGDVAPYWQAMGDRDSERGAQAIIDSNLNDLAVINGFAECTGTEITSSTTPCISALIKSSKHYIEQQANAMNGDWYRPHPYVQLADTTMLPNEEDSHSNESSYPSLQAMVGWGLALLLTEVMPDCQNQILKHGYEMGWSSVITGYHYPTDVQAARVMAAGLITKMHNETKFKNMLRAARQEYANLATKNINSTPSATYSSLLTSPPDSASVAFAADFYRWIWGKGIRNTELGEIARHDSQCNIDHLCGIYSEILGININKKSSPAIYNMISQAAQAGSNSTQAISTNHQRQQPFVLMNEQPWGINESSSPTSHPSSHASMVWSTALAVAQLAPQLQDTILSRALQCASSGVITGNCWQSDVDNAFYCGSLAMALLRSKNNFTTLAEEAQNEYLQLSGLSIDDLNSQFPSSTILETPAGVDNLHFFYDLSNYWKGKAMRNTERGRLANEDASTENSYLLNTFNNCVSTIDISESNTPYIATLIGMLKLTLNGHTTNLKNSSNRFRPFRQFSETIPYGGEAWQHYSESSYPSRHALLGWGIALVLAEVMPDCHSAIIKRGYEYGESRVITGLSYASDARDARIIAATVTNKLHNIPLFATLIHEAKAEYMRLKRPFGDVNGDFAVTSADIMVLYNWLLNNDSGNIVDGDLDGDGTITAADITIIYNILLGQNSEK